MSNVELEIRGLSKFFGKNQVLKNIDQNFSSGKFYCLLGPSGCGKTTLLRIIAGLETCEKGEIRYKGKSIQELPPKDRNFGMVFQSYALFPNLNIEKNIAYGLNGSSASKKARVKELLELIGLPGIEKMYPSQLSGGQQQRVSLSRSLAPNPDILLLDEPLSALDAKVRDSLRREIKALQRQLGIMMIMVTHDQEEAMVVADEIIIMNQGEIEQQDKAETIYERPATLFAADFIGKMNYLPVKITGAGKAELFGKEIDLGGQNFNAGQSCHIGIRPEDMVINPGNLNGLFLFDALVSDIEFYGSYRLVFFKVEQSGLPPVFVFENQKGVHDASLNQSMKIGFEIAKAQIFEGVPSDFFQEH